FEGWSEFIREYEVVHAGKREDKNDYHCVVRCILRIASAGTAREDVGYGHGYGKDPGSAEESAGKEAVTGALKRAAGKLGRALGGSLYDTAGDTSRERAKSYAARLEGSEDQQQLVEQIGSDPLLTAGQLRKHKELLEKKYGGPV